MADEKGNGPQGAAPEKSGANQDSLASSVGDVRLDEPAARRLTQRIQLILTTVSDQLDKLGKLVAEAKAGDAHVALGFRSWPEYVSKEFGNHSLRLDRKDRRELVALLAGEGMSSRSIAPVVGASKSTIDRDLAGAPNGAPGREVVGLDGKLYRPKRKRRRRPAEQLEIIGPDGVTPAPDAVAKAEFAAAHQLKVMVHEVTRTLDEIVSHHLQLVEIEKRGTIRGDDAEKVRVEMRKTFPGWRHLIDVIESQINAGSFADEWRAWGKT